jgi:hypothetical protein
MAVSLMLFSRFNRHDWYFGHYPMSLVKKPTTFWSMEPSSSSHGRWRGENVLWWVLLEGQTVSLEYHLHVLKSCGFFSLSQWIVFKMSVTLQWVYVFEMCSYYMNNRGWGMLIHSHCNNIIFFHMFVNLLFCTLLKNTLLHIEYLSVESNSGDNMSDGSGFPP